MDETEEACSKCSPGMAKCSSNNKCILDQKICDGNRDCREGEDEIEMKTSDNVSISCDKSGGHCRLFHTMHPK